MEPDGWYPDPLGLHGERWMTAGEPTHLVRDAWVESYDGPPRERQRVLVATPSQRGGLERARSTFVPHPPTDPRDVAFDDSHIFFVEPDGWDGFVRGDQPLSDGVATWLLRSMMDFDDVVTISDVHGSALRCGFYVDLLLAGLVDSDGQAVHSERTESDFADVAIQDLPHHKSLEHWIRLGHPHGHEFADVLVASGDWQPLHYVAYHRYRIVRAPTRSVCRYLTYVFDQPGGQEVAAVAALAALTGAWGYLGPERRKVAASLFAACGPAAEFVEWAAAYLNARMSEIAAAATANAGANYFGGGV